MVTLYRNIANTNITYKLVYANANIIYKLANSNANVYLYFYQSAIFNIQICDPDITLETEEIFSEICAKISQSVSGQENLKEAQQKSKDLIERLIKAFVST